MFYTRIHQTRVLALTLTETPAVLLNSQFVACDELTFRRAERYPTDTMHLVAVFLFTPLVTSSIWFLAAAADIHGRRPSTIRRRAKPPLPDIDHRERGQRDPDGSSMSLPTPPPQWVGLPVWNHLPPSERHRPGFDRSTPVATSTNAGIRQKVLLLAFLKNKQCFYVLTLFVFIYFRRPIR